MHTASEAAHRATPRSEPVTWRRRLWMAAGMLCMVTAVIGMVVPLLPTTDFVLLAAYCVARGSRRWEAWLLGHPRFGPLVRDWRATRAVPLSAKVCATAMMLASSGWAAWVLPTHTAWIPAAVCTLVAVYLWSRPTRHPTPRTTDAARLAQPDTHAKANGLGLS
jgi:uncharacterized protein